MAKNPFDDHDDDPFADDPFADSSITAGLHTSTSGQHMMDDEEPDAVPLHSVRKSEGAGGFLSSVGLGGSRGNSYKPLGEDVDSHQGYAGGSSYSSKPSDSYKPASSYSSKPNDAYKPDSSFKMGYGDDSREAELRRREEELAARERALNEREETLRTMPPGTRPALNFPPLYPVMYHDIDAEVPIGDRRTVRTIFYTWLALEALLIFNCISCLIVLLAHAEDVSNAGASFGSSFVYLFTISAASFFLWYRPVYNAYMKDSSMFFYFFFVFNGFHILFDAYMAVGIPGTGAAGIITMIQSLSSDKKAAAAFCGITFSFWVIHALVSLFMYFKVRHHYHARGHTFSEAKSQAYQGFAQSGAGQAAVSTAAGAYMRSNTGNFV